MTFKTKLSMDEAISVLGRSLPLKRGVGDKGEVVSFKYMPHKPIERGSLGAGAMVYVRYSPDVDGISVKATIMPAGAMMIVFILVFMFISAFVKITEPGDFTFFMFFIGWIIALLALWWETVEIKGAILSMFQDWMI